MPFIEHAGFALTKLFKIFELDYINNFLRSVCIRTQNSVSCLFGKHYPLPERINNAQLSLQAGMNERTTSTDVHEEQSILARRLDSCCCKL